MIKDVLVLGAGSAGLIAALSFKRKLPQLKVRVVRSPSIGVIGVGEATTPNFPRHLFEYLGISRKRFYALADPTWKLGIRFLWGERGSFDYTFNNQLDVHYEGFSKPAGYYCDDDFDNASQPGALMHMNMAWPRQANGAPDVHPWHAFHIENTKFVRVMEEVAREHGIEFIDGEFAEAERGPNGLTALHLKDGQRLEADFFVDCSGFRSELLGKTLQTPFTSFANSLFCDRAVVGGWERAEGEAILPFTVAETMDSGWAWRIDHKHQINRGYVFCSQAISDDAAAEEFYRKNPKIKDEPKIVKFRSGCYDRQWVDNVVALGNSSGFVEPLESTGIMMLCSHTQTLIELLRHSDLEVNASMRDLYNEATVRGWKDVKDFLSIHYKFNGLLDTPFWKSVRAEADVSNVQPLIDFYQENGPTGFCRYRLPQTQTDFGLEGYLVMLVGNKVPYKKRFKPSPEEMAKWEAMKRQFVETAKKGITSEEALAYVNHTGWQWHGDPR